MLKGGIIGFGNVAVNGHLPVWKSMKDIHISAVMDIQPDRITECFRLLPDARFYNSVEAMLNSEQLDFIDMATPPSTHAHLINKCLKKYLHVLCEKPLVTSSDDLISITELAKERDRVLFTVHNWRFSPMVKTLFSFVRQGKIGTLKKIIWEVFRTQPAVAVPLPGENHSNNEKACNWRLNPEIAGGGILIDHGWHAFYIIMELFGKVPTHVEGTLENRKYRDLLVEDTAVVSIFFPDGKAEAMFTWGADERRNRVEVTGSHGSIVLENDYIVLESPSEKKKINFSKSIAHGSHHPEWFGSTVCEFLEEIRKSNRKGENLYQASVCLALFESCRKSHRQNGSQVSITPPLNYFYKK